MPLGMRPFTPLTLKATAGLRLVSQAAADAVLHAVNETRECIGRALGMYLTTPTSTTTTILTTTTAMTPASGSWSSWSSSSSWWKLASSSSN